MLQVIQHQYRQAAALHLLRIGVDDFLFQMEALVAKLDGTGADGNTVRAFYLGKKLHLYLHHEDSILIPVKAFADGGNIVSLTRVVELEIYGIVHVPELVNVVETYLQRHHIVKLVTSFFCHIVKSYLSKTAAKLHNKPKKSLRTLQKISFSTKKRLNVWWFGGKCLPLHPQIGKSVSDLLHGARSSVG